MDHSISTVCREAMQGYYGSGAYFCCPCHKLAYRCSFDTFLTEHADCLVQFSGVPKKVISRRPANPPQVVNQNPPQVVSPNPPQVVSPYPPEVVSTYPPEVVFENPTQAVNRASVFTEYKMLEETWPISEMVTVSLVTVIHKAKVYNVATLSQVVIIEVGEAPLLHIKEEVHITIDDDAPDVPRKKDFYEAFLAQQKMIMSLQSQLKFFADYIVESEEKRNDRRRLKESETHQSVGLVSMMTDLAARVKVQEAHHNRGLVPVTADLPLKPPVKKGGV